MEKPPHPINEDGLPYVPQGYLVGCVETTPCVLRDQGACYMDVHHILPRRFSETAIDRKYQELPHNKERMCRALHRLFEETYQPPENPSQAFKAGFLIATGVHLSKRVRREVNKYRTPQDGQTSNMDGGQTP